MPRRQGGHKGVADPRITLKKRSHRFTPLVTLVLLSFIVLRAFLLRAAAVAAFLGQVQPLASALLCDTPRPDAACEEMTMPGGAAIAPAPDHAGDCDALGSCAVPIPSLGSPMSGMTSVSLDSSGPDRSGPDQPPSFEASPTSPPPQA